METASSVTEVHAGFIHIKVFLLTPFCIGSRKTKAETNKLATAEAGAVILIFSC